MNTTKGDYLGICNITACKTTKPAIYYNYSTCKYYCEECAERLNTDEFNKRDAMRNYGHDLCIEESVRPRTFNEIMEDDKKIYITDPYSKFRDNSGAFIVRNNDGYAPQSKCSTYIKTEPSQQNNDLCSCDSGLKYKKCCKNKNI
jgi:hypothetical protein